jgi:hypothetical protein
MLKIAVEKNGDWVERDCSPVFAIQQVSPKSERIAINLPRSSTDVFRTLSHAIEPPFYILYLLHTSRGEGRQGRYQSGPFERDQLGSFLGRFELFFSGDARHDIWIKAAKSSDLMVWDRHNDIFVYGEIDKFKLLLGTLGFREGQLEHFGPHQHSYREEFDKDAKAILEDFDWSWSPLRPEDEQ